MSLSEGFEGFDFGIERGDGFDQARNSECVANAAGFADEMKLAAFAAERDRDAHERRDAGAVNLRNAIEHHHHFTRAVLQDGLQRHGELFAGVADSNTAVHIKNLNAGVFAYVDFDGSVESHGQAGRHYTMTRRGNR